MKKMQLPLAAAFGPSIASTKWRKGSTLIELIIYTAILAIVLTGLVELMLFLLNTRAQTERKVNIQQGVRYAVERMQAATVGATDVFAADKGILILGSGSSALTKFFVSGGRIYMERTGFTPSPITPQSVWVQKAWFSRHAGSGSVVHLSLNAKERSATPKELLSIEAAFTVRQW